MFDVVGFVLIVGYIAAELDAALQVRGQDVHLVEEQNEANAPKELVPANHLP